MAVPGTSTFIVHKGSKVVIDYNIEDVASAESFKFYWAMAVQSDLTDKKIEKTTTGDLGNHGGITVDGSTVSITLDSADTDEASGIAVGMYACQLHAEDENNDPKVVAEDVINLKEAIYKLGVV